MSEQSLRQRRHLHQPDQRIRLPVSQRVQRNDLRRTDRLLRRKQPVPEWRNVPEPSGICFDHLRLPGRLFRRLLSGGRQRVFGRAVTVSQQCSVPKFREFQF